MRYYLVKRPEDAEALYFSKIKHLTNLPEGTEITAVISEDETETIEVVDGKPQIKGHGVHRAKSAKGRF